MFSRMIKVPRRTIARRREEFFWLWLVLFWVDIALRHTEFCSYFRFGVRNIVGSWSKFGWFKTFRLISPSQFKTAVHGWRQFRTVLSWSQLTSRTICLFFGITKRPGLTAFIFPGIFVFTLERTWSRFIIMFHVIPFFSSKSFCSLIAEYKNSYFFKILFSSIIESRW